MTRPVNTYYVAEDGTRFTSLIEAVEYDSHLSGCQGLLFPASELYEEKVLS